MRPEVHAEWRSSRPSWPKRSPSVGLSVPLGLHAAIVLGAALAGIFLLQPRDAAGADAPKANSTIRIVASHPWRPPFGLDRIGQPLSVVVEVAPDRELSEYALIGYLDGKEIARSALPAEGKPPYTWRVSFDPWPTELVLAARSAQGAAVELVRKTIEPAPFEADAVARPDGVVNPVDLGTILVPSDWLLLAGGQKGSIELAAICHTGDVPEARAMAWFESAPAEKATAGVALVKDRRFQGSLALPPVPAAVDRDVLHVSIARATGGELWHKKIQAMLVHGPPESLSQNAVRRGSPDPAELIDRTSSPGRETFGRVPWLGPETGHNVVSG